MIDDTTSTERVATITITLRESDGKTEMRSHQTGTYDTEADASLCGGWTSALECLAE